jgi:hypothetical protein
MRDFTASARGLTHFVCLWATIENMHAGQKGGMQSAASSPTGLWPLGGSGAMSVQRKRNRMPSMCQCEFCDRVFNSGYSLPNSYAAPTGNRSPGLAARIQPASTQLFMLSLLIKYTV